MSATPLFNDLAKALADAFTSRLRSKSELPSFHAEIETHLQHVWTTARQPLIDLLRESKREHRFIVDARRGKRGRDAIDGCSKGLYPDDVCTCGVDAFNARVEEALKST